MVHKHFPGFAYWFSLPGIQAFTGLSCGIMFGSFFNSPALPQASFYSKILILTSVLTLTSAILSRKSLYRLLLFLICGYALFTYTEIKTATFYHSVEALCIDGQFLILEGKICGPVALQNGRFQFKMRVISSPNPNIHKLFKNKLFQCTSKKAPPSSGFIKTKGFFSLPDEPIGPYGFNQKVYFLTQNLWGKLRIAEVSSSEGHSDCMASVAVTLRSNVHKVIARARSEDVRSIFHAAFLGERELLSATIKDLFRKAGIFHLLAISGFHAGLLFMAFLTTMKLTRLPTNTCITTALAGLWGYLFFIGLIPSLFRATIMVTFVCGSILIQRKNHVVHSLGMAGVIWLLLSPHSLFTPGFQLSFAATAGIVLLYPVLNSLTPELHSRIGSFLLKWLLSSIWISLSGFLFTAPVLLYHFGAVSLFGILFNVLAIPLMSMAMWVFFFGMIATVIPPLSTLLIGVADALLSLLIYTAKICYLIPFSELHFSAPTALQIITAAVFVMGLCAVHKTSRAVYLKIGGGLTLLLFAVLHLSSLYFGKTELVQMSLDDSSISAVILKNRAIWLIGLSDTKKYHQICEQGLKPLLHHRQGKSVDLVITSEDGRAELENCSSKLAKVACWVQPPERQIAAKTVTLLTLKAEGCTLQLYQSEFLLKTGKTSKKVLMKGDKNP